MSVTLLLVMFEGHSFAQSTAAGSGGATYSESIGPLIEVRCMHCHRPGGIAPMSFSSYEDVRRWAKQSYTPLDTLIRTRAMPPWPADPSMGEFANREFMTDGEIELFLEWIGTGLLRGDGDYKGPALDGDWVGGTPDHVFELPAHTVAESTIGEYTTVEVTTDFAEDRWIIGSEIKPGNPYAVRGVLAGVLGTYQAGQVFTRYSSPYGMRLEKAAVIPIRIHYYNEEGIEEVDQSRVAIRFSNDDVVRRAIREAPMRAEPFMIPAGATEFDVSTQFTFADDSEIVSLLPIMHSRGSRVVYSIRRPDGAEETLLAIPVWNPNWKYRYAFREAVSAPKGSIVTATATFDNSEANLKNPDPWSRG